MDEVASLADVHHSEGYDSVALCLPRALICFACVCLYTIWVKAGDSIVYDESYDYGGVNSMNGFVVLGIE